MTQYKQKIKYQLTDAGIKFFYSQPNSIVEIALFCKVSSDLLYRTMRLQPATKKTIKALQKKYKDFVEGLHYNEIK